jgi:phytoene dehydrogenase-like protein
MDRLFQDEELKLLLNTNVQYYHNKISELNILFHAVAQHSFFDGGGYFIKGGSQVLSDYLVSIIEKYGGKVILAAEVISIDKKKKNATSVAYLDKRDIKHILYTDIVISNLSPEQTYAMAALPYEEQKTISTSLLSIYIGFKKNLKSVYGKRPYTTFLFREIDTIEKHDSSNAPLPERGFVFTDYSQIEAGLTSKEKSFGVFCGTDSLQEWEGLNKEAYNSKKATLAQAYVAELSKEYPDIESHIEFIEVGTAKTMQRYLKTPNGTAYGFAPTAEQFFRIPKTRSDKLNNLYFVGAWVIGGGFSAAIISAEMCYNTILNK